MSRTAARSGFERFLEETVTVTREAFSVRRALRGTGLGVGGAVVDRLRTDFEGLERQVVEPELRTYREQAVAQFEVVLDYAESDAPIEAYRDELLANHSYVDALRPDVSGATRTAVIEQILARNRRLGEGIEPVVARPEDKFWPAVGAAYDREAALALVEEGFPFTGPLREHRTAFTFDVRVDPADVLGGVGSALPSAEIEYTDEAIRAMTRAERRVVHETKRELDRRFADGA